MTAQASQELSPLAAEMLRRFPYLLNPELAEHLADVAATYYRYRAARCHADEVPATIRDSVPPHAVSATLGARD